MQKILYRQVLGYFLGPTLLACLFVSNANAQPTPSVQPPDRGLQGEVIRSLPTLPRTQHLEEHSQKEITVPKPETVGGTVPNVKTIRLSGFESEIAGDMAGYKIVSKYFPLQLTQEDWKRASEEIWAGYRDLGKLVRVDLVADNDEFIVSISLLRIRKIIVRSVTASDTRVDQKEIKRIEQLARSYISEGQVADLFDLKKFLLHMDYRAKEMVSTQVASANGDAVDVTFTVAKRERKSVQPWLAGVDNYGLNGFGKYRFTGRYSAPLFSAGDNIAVQTLLSEGQEFGSTRYDFPIGYTLVRGSVWVNMLHYKVNANNPITQNGQSTMTGVDLSYPFFLHSGGLITASTGYEFKGTKDYINQRTRTLFTEKWVNNVHLRASGENLASGRLTFSSDITFGNLNIAGAGASFDSDSISGANTQGNFSKLYLEGQFVQPVTVASSFTFNAKGQFSDKNLDSLEKMSFAGVNGVRAYNSDVGVGDEGVLLSASYALRLNTKIPARLGLFYDHAFITTSHAPSESEFAGQDYGNHYRLDAAGVQFTTGYKQVMLNATVAYPVTRSNADPRQRWRLWTQLTYSF